MTGYIISNRSQYLIRALYYSVADSIRFMLANMNTPETRQIAMSTVQIAQRGILIQRSPGTDTR